MRSTETAPRASIFRHRGAAIIAAHIAITAAGRAAAAPDTEKPRAELLRLHGEGERSRIERGLAQAGSLWRDSDGDSGEFSSFATRHFVPAGPRLEELLRRLEAAFEAIDGHLNEIARELRWNTDLDTGPLLPVDELLARHNPQAHIIEDLFRNGVGFIVLLNFPLTTLEERLRDGPEWDRRRWAGARLAQRFSRRVPAEVEQEIAAAVAAGETYIAGYDIWMHHVLDRGGERLFPGGLRLISHWNLRDELKAAYALPDGVRKQRLIARVMERIVTQTIPRAAIADPSVDWKPETNELSAAPAATVEDPTRPRASGEAIDPSREPDTRYAHLLATFRAARKADPYSPATPSLMARRFEEDREIPEAKVRSLLEAVIGSAAVRRTGALISKRLGRPLEPFDIWYDGFRERSRHPEPELDALTRKAYPSAEAFSAAIPGILEKLGFSGERARYLADRMAVDPSRGAGHAMPALRRGDKPRLRTRIEKGGMNYKGFNIAVHELGHNVEQVFSLYDVDSTLLAGVPNNAFTEALAFVFQSRDLELLGLARPDARSESARVLNDLWMTFEIAGPALVDMAAWRWMYEHPDADAAALREAVLGIARDTWNRHYAPIVGVRDSVLLAVYSHMVNLMLYLPDYPLGHLIAFQIEKAAAGKDLGPEFERMARIGRVTPDLWMMKATGSPVSAQPLLEAAEKALAELGG